MLRSDLCLVSSSTWFVCADDVSATSDDDWRLVSSLLSRQLRRRASADVCDVVEHHPPPAPSPGPVPCDQPPILWRRSSSPPAGCWRSASVSAAGPGESGEEDVGDASSSSAALTTSGWTGGYPTRWDVPGCSAWSLLSGRTSSGQSVDYLERWRPVGLARTRLMPSDSASRRYNTLLLAGIRELFDAAFPSC